VVERHLTGGAYLLGIPLSSILSPLVPQGGGSKPSFETSLAEAAGLFHETIRTMTPARTGVAADTRRQTAVFSVVATGAGLTYQWLFDGTDMDGATNRTLMVTNAQPAQSGYYSVIVSNASGSVTSQVAVLKVFLAAPHGFGSIQAESNGFVNLSFNGETTALFGPYYDLYPLETSSNLVDWVPLVTLQRTNAALDTLRFLDAEAPEFTRSFYRTPTNAFLTPIPQ
jgi:hypothetical protein